MEYFPFERVIALRGISLRPRSRTTMTRITTIVTQIHEDGYGPSAWKVIADPAPVTVTATLNLAGGAARRAGAEGGVLMARDSWRYERGLVTARSPLVVSPDTSWLVPGCPQLALLDSRDVDIHLYLDRYKELVSSANCEQLAA